MIITRTPHRISLAGGGTDFPAWYNEHGGAVVGFALAHYCYVSLRTLPPYHAGYRHRVVWSKIELVNELWEIEHPAIAAVLADQCVEEGLEIHHAGDVPARAGLGSSSTFTVGLLHALSALRGRMASHEELATEAIRIEQQRMHEAVGSQDQCWAAHGSLNRIDFDASGPRVRRLILPQEREHELLDSLMLLYTGTQRIAAEIEARKVATLDQHHTEMMRLREMVDEVEAILTAPMWRVGALGATLEEGWRLKRGLAPGVSSSALDALYTRAKAAGAAGGKMLGAGGGGCYLFAVEPERRAELRAALAELIEIPLRIDRDGSRVVVYEPNGWNS